MLIGTSVGNWGSVQSCSSETSRFPLLPLILPPSQPSIFPSTPWILFASLQAPPSSVHHARPFSSHSSLSGTWTCCSLSPGALKGLSHVQLFGTPWAVAHQAPLTMGILQARIMQWVAMPSSRGSSQPRYRTQVSHFAGRFFTTGGQIYRCRYKDIDKDMDTDTQIKIHGSHPFCPLALSLNTRKFANGFLSHWKMLKGTYRKTKKTFVRRRDTHFKRFISSVTVS